jgi:murein DD-endopeptidase MepM/ murein hydrolase activator NlpD
VERTFTNRGGLSLVLALDNGLRAGFAHLSETVAQVGARVATGDVIAYTGDSGAPGQPHLHFTLNDGNRYLDPAKLCA